MRKRSDAGDIHTVVFDDTEGGEIATRSLISQGHRVIAYLGGPSDFAANRNRLTGYRRALAQANIPFDPALARSGSGPVESGEQVLQFFTRPVDRQSSHRHLEPARGDLRVPTAIFCYNDMIAIGALSALKRHGLGVPDDVSVVGFDDIPFAAYVDPRLTTIHQPKDEMGRLAMRMLFDLLDGKRVSNVMLSGRLIVRESTCASPQANPETAGCKIGTTPRPSSVKIDLSER